MTTQPPMTQVPIRRDWQAVQEQASFIANALERNALLGAPRVCADARCYPSFYELGSLGALGE